MFLRALHRVAVDEIDDGNYIDGWGTGEEDSGEAKNYMEGDHVAEGSIKGDSNTEKSGNGDNEDPFDNKTRMMQKLTEIETGEVIKTTIKVIQ